MNNFNRTYTEKDKRKRSKYYHNKNQIYFTKKLLSKTKPLNNIWQLGIKVRDFL